MNKTSIHFSQSLRQYFLQFADLYHKYKTDLENLHTAKYHICSSFSYYKKTGLIQLAYNDRPGDLLPPMSISEVKHTMDILAGLHPIDVNSVNDLYYLLHDKISELEINDTSIQVKYQNGEITCYDINTNFDGENTISKRVSFLIGYIQAENFMKKAFSSNKEKYRIIKDHITTLHVLNLETKKTFLMNASDILFSDDYLLFSKEDISRIGYICGQMSKLQMNSV